MPNRTYQEYYRSQCPQTPQGSSIMNHGSCSDNQQYSYTHAYYNPIQSASQQPLHQYHDYYPKTTASLETSMIPQHSSCEKEWLPATRAENDIEKGLGFTDKIETIEITSNDLSPASCCNFDLLLHDYYNKNYTEFPSCSQAPFEQNSKKAMYCSIQKPSNECNYMMTNPPSDCFQDVFSPSLSGDICADINFATVDRMSAGDDSDIIVENLDEEEYIVENNKEPNEIGLDKFHCLLCNVTYSPTGSQFYFVTTENPLTMSTQKSVSDKLKSLIGIIPDSYLCYQCLELINAIDHLEMKLNGLRQDVIRRYELNNVVNAKRKMKQISKHKQCTHKLTCRICKCTMSLRNIFKNHLQRHRQHKRFLCEVCGKRFTTVKVFQHHIQSHVDIEANLIQAYKCTICSKLFRTKSNLNEHSNYCSGKLPFRCMKCHKKFPTATKLKNHIKLKHEKKFTSICSICNIGFVQISDYKRHMISHSTHKKFNCNQCNKSYKTLSNLNFHMKYHGNRLPFICGICPKGFMRKEYLESHMASHSGEKNFACTMCEKKFVSQKNLDAHLKYHNGGINKKSCNICGKMISKTSLEDHLRTHSNLKEFKCDSCDEQFNTRSSLQKHKKRKHNN